MTTNLIALNQNQTLMDALVICLANKIKHIPVIDDDENLCGIITYTDIATNHRNYLEYQIAVYLPIGFLVFIPYAIRIRKLSNDHKFHTLSDWFYYHYDNKTGLASALILFIILS